MRIRKLAAELSTDPDAVIALLASLGHTRYTDPEQQLPDALTGQIRRHARTLPKAAPAPRPRSSYAPRETDPELALLAKELAGVTPLVRKEPARPAPAAKAPAPARAAAPQAPAPAPKPDPRIAEAEALRLRVAALEQDLAEVDTHRRSLQRQLAEKAQPDAPVTLREALLARGLVGEDECVLALRALLDAHRVGELLDHCVAGEPVEELVWNRLLLLAEGEDVPPGIVAVRVPPDRSEGPNSSVNRAALARFATACLLHNVRRVMIVGGSPAYHRVLRDGMDTRIDLRLVPGNRRGRLPESAGADIVLLWASTILDHSVSDHFPEGIVIPHRGIARFLGAAVDEIERRHR